MPSDDVRPGESVGRVRADAGDQLPEIDEHTAIVAAGVEAVWSVLLDEVTRTFGSAAATLYARVVGCVDPAPSGPRPLEPGSTVSGLRAVRAVPGEELTLQGRHRFSTYALTFRLEQLGPDSTRMHVASRASFPGLHGRLYRLLVVSTGLHVIAVSRLLDSIRRQLVPPIQ
jgi:hypothetical protein